MADTTGRIPLWIISTVAGICNIRRKMGFQNPLRLLIE